MRKTFVTIQNTKIYDVSFVPGGGQNDGIPAVKRRIRYWWQQGDETRDELIQCVMRRRIGDANGMQDPQS